MIEDGIDWSQGGEQVLPLAMPKEDHETHYMVDRCMEWIRSRDKPWITHLSLLRPHPPFHAPAPYHAHHDPGSVPGPLRRETPDEEAGQHPLLDYFINHSRYRAPDSRR